MDNKHGVQNWRELRVVPIVDIQKVVSLLMPLIEVTHILHTHVTIAGFGGTAISLEVDTTFEQVAHTIRTGKVVMLPAKKLKTGNGANGRGIMPWDTDMELEIGDTVLFSFDVMARILSGTDHILISGDRLFVQVPYHNISMVKRGDIIFPVNGYVICEPVDINTEDKILGYHQGFQTPDAIGKTYSNKIAIVRYIGKSVRSYWGVPQDADGEDVEVGDMVIYMKQMDIKLEDELHQDFLPIKGLFKIQRRYLLLKVVK